MEGRHGSIANIRNRAGKESLRKLQTKERGGAWRPWMVSVENVKWLIYRAERVAQSKRRAAFWRRGKKGVQTEIVGSGISDMPKIFIGSNRADLGGHLIRKA